MYITVTSKSEIITTHHCRDVEVIRVQDMYVDHWKVKNAPGVMKYTVYYWIFLLGAVLYEILQFLLLLFSFSTAEIVLFLILVSYFKMSPRKNWIAKKKLTYLQWWNQSTKKFAPQEKGFRQMRLNFKWRSVKKKMQYLVAKVYFKTLFAISMSCYITWISLNQVCDKNYFF